MRGYFHWSFIDTNELAEGYAAHFGLYGYNARTLRRTERPSARLYRRIARTGVLPVCSAAAHSATPPGVWAAPLSGPSGDRAGLLGNLRSSPSATRRP